MSYPKPNRPIMLKPPFRLMVVARSQMGKTSLLIKLMLYYWIEMFDRIYIFCPTYAKDNKWRVLDEYLTTKIQVYAVVKETTIKNIWKQCDMEKEKNEDAQFLILCDDCAGQADFKINNEQGIINQLVSKGNHSNISTVWVVQKFTQCSTIMRTNAEGLLTFYVQSEDEMKYIWKEFGVGQFKVFRDVLKENTKEKYHNFYINRQGPGMPDYYHNFKYLVL